MRHMDDVQILDWTEIGETRKLILRETQGVSMNKWMVLALMLSLSGMAQAAKNCTDVPKDKWMTEADFKKKVEGDGYKISKFKQPGSCYEIYGTDKSGKKVEIYFNPVDASVVQSK